MHTQELNKELEQQISEINETIKKVQYNQIQEITLLQKNHTINMQKLNKLQEYNKIADMTNQLFERRLLALEQVVKELNKNICSYKN